MIRILIIDDEPLARQLVLEYMEDFPGFEVIRNVVMVLRGSKPFSNMNPT